MLDDRIDSIMPFIHRVLLSGGILLDPEKDSLERIFEEMQLDGGTTFQLLHEENSLGDSLMFYQRYQQYYNDVEVYGGGFTMAYIKPGGGGPCPPTPQLLSPYIKFDISISTTPVVSKHSLAALLDADTVFSSPLIIGHNLDTLCEYTLFYLVDYYDGENKISWVNAATGDVYLTTESGMFINISAPTQDYSQVSIDNLKEGDITSLQAEDETIKVYDFNQLEGATEDHLSVKEYYEENLIPTTTGSSWTTEAVPGVFQTFYSTAVSKKGYNDSGISLGQLHIGYCDCVVGAGNTRLSTKDDYYIAVGQIDNASASQIDVLAHEISHAYLRSNNILSRDTDYGKSVHEGMADIFGTYMEYLDELSVDWIIADNNEDVAEAVNRDLENPNSDYDCYTEIATTTIQHQGGVPLGHWFYLISEGATNIPALGVDEAFSIVKDALLNIPFDSDYHDIMVATLGVVEERYGICSDQFDAVANAWEKICVSTGMPMTEGVVNSCDLQINYLPAVCEEEEYANICIPGVISDDYVFTIIGKGSTEFESACGMTGNSQYDCSYCLTLEEFPNYPYYPQVITIEVRALAQASDYVKRIRLTILDCNNDDPTCEEYYDIDELQTYDNYGNADQDYLRDAIITPSERLSKEYEARLVVFDILGRQIIESEGNQIAYDILPRDEILLFVYYDHLNHIIKVEKKVFFE